MFAANTLKSMANNQVRVRDRVRMNPP